MAATNYDPEIRLRRGGPPEWLAAVRRAGLIATYSRSYGHGIDEHEAVDLLALLLYCLAPAAGGADAVEIDAVIEVVADADFTDDDLQRVTRTVDWSSVSLTPEFWAEQDARSQRVRADRRARLERLYRRLADGLRQAGHDLDRAAVTGRDEMDPVVAAWLPLNLESADTPPALTEYPAWMVHPQGSTPLGRAVPTVHHWLHAQAEPHTDTGGLRDFTATAWQPPGPRLHIHVPVNDAVRALAEVYAPVLHAWRHLLRPVDPRFLHLTLAWHRHPASEVTGDQRLRLFSAVRDALSAVAPATLTVGRPVITPRGVVLDVSPDHPVWQLTGAARQAFDTVFGPSSCEYPSPGWWPHIALAYTHASGPAEGLAYDLARFPDHRTGPIRGGHRPTPVELPVTGLLVVDQDTYAPTGLTWTNDTRVDRTRAWPGPNEPVPGC